MQNFDVFLSHNSRDKPAVLALAEALRTRGLRPWLDVWQLRPGQPWQEALEEVITMVSSIAVVVGQDGLGPWEIMEMRAVLEEFVRRSRPVIPVLLPGTPRMPKLPLFLQGFTWVDLRDGLDDTGIDRLVWGITGDRPESRRPPDARTRNFSSALASWTEAVPWGTRWLERLDQDEVEPTHCQRVDARRWLLRIRISRELRQLYGTAPEILVLVVADEVEGGDLTLAQKELYRREFDLDMDLLVVMDGEPGLAQRLSRLVQFRRHGQWVPWSAVNGAFPSLAEQLAAHLSVHDIFERQDPVRGRQVIGRTRIVSDISRRLMEGQAVGVFGLRKIGKTTVVRAVTDRLDPISARLSLSRVEPLDIGGGKSAALVAWLDCQRDLTRSLDSVAELLHDELERRFDIERLDVSRAAGEKDPLTRLDHVLAAALRHTSTPICIVLDEYDLLFEGASGQPAVRGIERLFGMLRAHAQETGRLALVAIGRDPDFFERPEMGGRTNPMLQWFIPRWLGPMTPDDAGELLLRLGRRALLDVGESSAQLAYHWTGGHPLLHRQYGSALLQLARRDQLATHIPTDPFHEEAIDLFLDRGAVMTICREVLFLLKKRYPDAVELLREMSLEPVDCAGDLFQETGSWHLPATRILKNFGLLSGTRQSPNVPELFRWYIRTFEPRLPRAAAQ